jgi:wyosine [tRNA(Phe)-imidazoG37] synthetase (radical SAM superfamily)
MSSPQKRFVFGPVPSRRLGRSLGVDLVPYKTCSYDCVYCQLGKTAEKTVERKIHAPADAVIEQLREYLDKGDRPDVITVSGSGEPTLHQEIGKILNAVKEITDLPVAVLTNGSMLYRPEVREALMSADIISPNLDAGAAELFEIINRPHPEINFEDTVEGLRAFARDFEGRLLVEVFVLGRMNASPEELGKIARITDGLDSAVVQLNTVARPPAKEYALRVPEERLCELARLFRPAAEVIAEFRSGHREANAGRASERDVLEMLARRPATPEDIASGLKVDLIEAEKCVERLSAEQKIRSFKQGGKAYYALADREK